MKKAVIIIAPGFEESETLTIVDIMRRANLTCDMMGFERIVTGGHHITIECDKTLNKSILDYDMIILPGGIPGATNLCEHDLLIHYLQLMNQQHKYICAICAAPIVLEKANLLQNKYYTAYNGYDQKIKQGTYLNDSVVVDGHIVTSRGPATTYAFSYQLVELLGESSTAIKDRMLYHHAFKKGDE